MPAHTTLQVIFTQQHIYVLSSVFIPHNIVCAVIKYKRVFHFQYECCVIVLCYHHQITTLQLAILAN